ncbi:MAG: lipopolysaccharide biosynthesis protein [Lachnospiraceae bacterium]|nr:lipopolysaccharide biosynthesis protein [Lachnospiraceae bacterium]
MSKKNFLYYSKNVEKDSYIWNMTGSMLNAFQSVIFLVILTRIVDLKESGFFVIAYANANLFLNIGKYGMRNFQVSDVNDQFSFKEYKISRYITTVLMMLVSIIYVLIAGHFNGYTVEKSMIIIWMCLFKAVDAVEDVYLGLYQQKSRLDISGKCMTLRMIATIFIFAVSLLVCKKLLPAIIVSTIATVVILFLTISMTYGNFIKDKKIKLSFERNRLMELFRICFPLFLGLFLAFYIGNAPKYAIDAVLSDELQAIYGFIAMPVFIIGLLNNFIFNPIIVGMSVKWKEKNINEFKRLFKRQIIIIGGIIAFCELGAFLLGIPVLSILYNTDLKPYKTELLILLLGGGFLAYSGFLVTILTIMRKQKVIAFVYMTVSVLAFVFSSKFVSYYGITGASLLYLILMVLLCIMFAVPAIFFIGKMSQQVDNISS